MFLVNHINIIIVENNNERIRNGKTKEFETIN
jgi:hypothetical protein